MNQKLAFPISILVIALVALAFFATRHVPIYVTAALALVAIYAIYDAFKRLRKAT